MRDIEIKTTANLLDQFVTNQIKCYMAQERLMDRNLSNEDRLKMAIMAQETNALRTELIRVLTSRLNSPGVTNATKTYLNKAEK